MVTDADARAAGFATPTALDRIRDGDDVIRQNARAALELANTVRAEIPRDYVPGVRSANLFNPDLASPESFLLLGGATPGATTPLAGYTVSDYIPVTPGESITLPDRNLAWYRPGKTYLSGDSANSTQAVRTVTVPAGAAWLRFSLSSSKAADAMAVKGTTYPSSYIDPAITAPSLKPPTAGPLTLTKTGTTLALSTLLGDKVLTINATTKDTARNNTFNMTTVTLGGTPIHGFTPGDDMAPIRTQMGTLGGNHGFSTVTTLTNPDGKDTTDLGNVYSDGAREYVVLAVTPTKVTLGGSYTRTAAGVVTSANAQPTTTLTYVSGGGAHQGAMDHTTKAAPGIVQLYPSSTRADVTVWIDGAPAADGTTRGRTVEIRESYEVMDYADLYDQAKANPGTPYTSLTIAGSVRVTTTLRFTAGGKCAVTVELLELAPTDLGVVGVVQSVALSATGMTTTRYLPGVTGWTTGVDLTSYASNTIVTTADLTHPGVAPPYTLDVLKQSGTTVAGFLIGYPPFGPRDSDATNQPRRLAKAPTNLWDLRATKKSYPTATTGEAHGWQRLAFTAVRAYLSPTETTALVAAITAPSTGLTAWAAAHTLADLPQG